LIKRNIKMLMFQFSCSASCNSGCNRLLQEEKCSAQCRHDK
jgi:hypothetical protein